MISLGHKKIKLEVHNLLAELRAFSTTESQSDTDFSQSPRSRFFSKSVFKNRILLASIYMYKEIFGILVVDLCKTFVT